MSPVYVAHVKTPSCFTIQLIGEKTTKALEYLQEDLSQFYSGSESDKYRIDTPYIGQVRICIYSVDVQPCHLNHNEYMVWAPRVPPGPQLIYVIE